MSHRIVSIYVDATRAMVQDANEHVTIRQLKAQIRERLTQKLGLTDDSFHPAKNDQDIIITVPTCPSLRITDEDTVANLCPSISDYIMAIVPSAPTLGSPGIHSPEVSLLFPIMPLPAPPSPLPSALSTESHGDIVKMFQDLKLKLEEQRKADIAKVEAEVAKVEKERKADAAKARADIAKVEAEVAKVEKERKADAAKARADIAKVEAEVAKVEKQRKTDMAKAEEQRKKDQQYSGRLEKRIKELESEIEWHKRHADEREQEHNLQQEAMHRYIESLAEDIDATTDFFAIGDEAALDRIKRRNLLDQAQTSLGISLGLVSNSYLSSLKFRDALGPSSSDDERQNRLVEILTEKKDMISHEAANLLVEPAALSLLAMRHPRVRFDSDQVAHGYRQRSWYEGSVSRSVGTDKAALVSLLDFVFPAGQ